MGFITILRGNVKPRLVGILGDLTKLESYTPEGTNGWRAPKWWALEKVVPFKYGHFWYVRFLGCIFWWPFWDGEHVTLSKVVGDLQLGYKKVSVFLVGKTRLGIMKTINRYKQKASSCFLTTWCGKRLVVPKELMSTPWKFNSSPLKISHPKRKVIFEPSFFRGYVKLRGCNFLVGFNSDLNFWCKKHSFARQFGSHLGFNHLVLDGGFHTAKSQKSW